REALHVAPGIELRLAGKADGRSGTALLEGDFDFERRVFYARGMCAVAHLLQALVLARLAHEKAVDPLELPVDRPFGRHPLDEMDGRAVSRGGGARTLLAEALGQRSVVVVEDSCQVRRAPARVAGSDEVLLQNQHAVCGAEQVREGESGDAGADDADVDFRIF